MDLGFLGWGSQEASQGKLAIFIRESHPSAEANAVTIADGSFKNARPNQRGLIELKEDLIGFLL